MHKLNDFHHAGHEPSITDLVFWQTMEIYTACGRDSLAASRSIQQMNVGIAHAHEFLVRRVVPPVRPRHIAVLDSHAVAEDLYPELDSSEQAGIAHMVQSVVEGARQFCSTMDARE